MRFLQRIVIALTLMTVSGAAMAQTVTVKKTVAKLPVAAAATRDAPVVAPVTYTTVTASVFVSGTGQGYTGVSTTYWHFKGIPNLTADAFMATGISGKTSVIVGTVLNYKVYSNANGWVIKVGAGITGFDVVNGTFGSGSHLGILSASLSIPIGH